MLAERERLAGEIHDTLAQGFSSILMLIQAADAQLAPAPDTARAQLALAWMLSKPYVTSPIIGATKMQHLEDAVAALSIELSPEEVKSLEELYEPHPVLGFS